MKIKNIIFDLGGVIYDIRYENVADEFYRLGLRDFEKIYSQASQNHIIDKFETGEISAKKFREEIREVTQLNLNDNQIDHAWNSILIGVPNARVELLGSLKLKYNTFLFSNTNIINYDSYHPLLEKQFGFDIFQELFNKAFFSHQIGHRKPNVDAFLYILKDQNLDPKETLFIDDSPQHIEGARKAGLNAYWLEKGNEILDLFDENLELVSGII